MSSCLRIVGLPNRTTVEDIESSLDLDRVSRIQLVGDSHEPAICLGYGYIHFASHEDALYALSKYQGTNIKRLGINFKLQLPAGSEGGSIDSFQVFAGNLPLEFSDRDLFEFCAKYSDHIGNARVIQNSMGKGRGYGFVQFDSDEWAYKFVDMFHSPVYTSKLKLCDRDVVIRETYRRSRAEIERGVDHLANTTIFVGNINLNFADDDLKQAFEKFGTVYSSRVVPSRGFGFVTFTDHVAALAALSEMQNAELGQYRIHCFWGRKQDAPDEVTMAHIQADNQTDDYYTSMIPSMPRNNARQDDHEAVERSILLREALDTLPSIKRRKMILENVKARNSAFIREQLLKFINI